MDRRATLAMTKNRRFGNLHIYKFMTLRINLSFDNTKLEPWIAGFQALLPAGTVVDRWSPGAPGADHAVVWAPSQQFVDEQSACLTPQGLPRLKAMFNMGAGVDALMKLTIPPHLKVVRLNDAGMSAQMAEFVCHALIRHFRDLDGYEADMSAGKWSYRKPRNRSDYPVGVMGLGVLGERVARAVAQFDFPVLGWSRSPKQVDGVQCFAGADQFDDFLQASKVLVCLLPLTPDTQDILCHRNLSKLQPGGYVINVARGGHLVDDDLIALLDSGHLAGATLDVFRTEPLPAGHAFWQHPKIAITPHTSARTLRDETIAQIAGKIMALERGEPIAGIVDAVRGY